MTILVTGTAGFVGFHAAKKLLERGDSVVGYDIVNDYYDVDLKMKRLEILGEYENFTFYKEDLCDLEAVEKVFAEHTIDRVCHLAAQAGVRYSLTNPHAYQKANLEAFLNILDTAKNNKVKNFVYASSSSVYGGITEQPFHEKMDVSIPVSLYAATKKSNELMARSYSHMYGIPTTGLRFFTAYGPWGRPDMALYIFAENILAGKPIDVFNNGECYRDFTYIDDIVQGVIASIDTVSKCEVFNLARGETIKLLDFIAEIEYCLGKQAIKNLLPLQPGDVPRASGDISHAKEVLKYEPQTSVKEGIKNFIEWFNEYKKENAEK